MNLPTEIFGDVVVIHAPEDLGEDQAEQLKRFLTSLEKSKVIFDFDGAESVDSHSLAALLDAQDSLRDLGGDLKVTVTNKINRKILEITRLDRQLEIFESVIDAVKSFA